ncbi:hypothetical protein RRF57_004601 [Xylaria bambusicola]|uniref:Uncharacterized protein n=1 Tax=Xylaria bambusicola TaxID=326684 RepID=A0AAN7UP34_9PEZI
MAGNGSTEPSKASVMEAMMNDLGPHRLEELARDDARMSRQRRARPAAPTQPRSARLRNNGKASNGLAEKYRADALETAAIREGKFDDDDAAAVKNLDPLDGGNAHRMNRLVGRSIKHEHNPVQYDPRSSEPTYSRKFKLTNKDPNVSRRPDVCNATHGGPVLRGFCPEGGEVKRWHSGRLVGEINNITNSPSLSASQGHAPPGSKSSPEKSIQTPGHGRGRGRGRGGAQSPFRPLPRDEWVPPHLRQSSGSRSPVPPSAAVSRQTSPRPSQFTIEDTALGSLENPHKTAKLDAREIFFQDNVHVVQYDGPNLPVKGQITIYELLDAPICVWELMIEDKEIRRGDVRELLEVLENGSMSYLRRHRTGGPVRSNPLRFTDIDRAKKFVQEANFRRNQYIGSSETIYDETTVRLSPAQHAAICKAAVEPVAEKTQQMAMPQPQTPPKAVAVNHQRIGSGWSDKDLISFSPGLPIQSQQNDSRARLEREQSVKVKQLNLAEEATKALRHVEVGTVRHLSPASLQVVAEISKEYDQLTHRSTLLSIALDTPNRDPAFLTTLTHLAQKQKFLNLSHDDQKDCLSVICSIVRHGDARIVRSQEEILALRSEEACPEAIKELNALIQRQRGRVPISQPAHVRSLTADTMTRLAGQLEMLSMK